MRWQHTPPIRLPRVFDVIVVGAGLAGCSTAIHLVTRGRSVLLIEKQHFPVHKLCGEFLSGEAQAYLFRLGVLEAVNAAGARPIDRAVLTAPEVKPFSTELTTPGFGISRWTLDHLLMVRAIAAGVTVRQGLSVKSIDGDLSSGFGVQTLTEAFEARVVVGAFGKRSTLDRKLGRPSLQLPRPYVAFKAHYRGSSLLNAVELHAFPGGYLGLCPLGERTINVCWVAEDRLLRELGGSPDALLSWIAERNPHIAERLQGLERLQSTFLATSQLHFRPKEGFAKDVAMVGDAAGLIAPMCGDGMSMAMRSGELFAAHADRFLRRGEHPETFKRRYLRRWALEFRFRMDLGYFLHWGYCNSRASRFGLRAVRTLPGLGNALVRLTRG